MKVAFFITSKGPGVGGHFYSLRATVEALAKQFDTEIINIGLFPSVVLRHLTNWQFFPIQRPILKTLLSLRTYVGRSRPDVLHAFDLESLLFCRFLALLNNKPVLFTKCGGPNPIRYFPIVDEMIVYSSENLSFFEKSARYSHAKIHHIANRIQIVEQDPLRIEMLRQKIRPGATVFMRISRISKFHKPSILSSIELVRGLIRDGHNVQLLLVGAVQDQSFAKELWNYAGKDIIVEAEDQFTRDASRLLGIADFVIGTGRGAMEAAFLGKVLLAPTANAELPILVNAGNIEQFFSYNFSGRAVIPNASEVDQYNLITAFVENAQLRKDYADFITAFARRNFDINTRLEDYARLYGSLQKKGACHPIDLLFHMELVRRSLNQAREEARKRGETVA
ncbi:MAG: hypothetical protein A4E58_02323 [Syntrophorhabdus sp. PtaB.Bin006]|nr:MAG: hypothetical protein A4E58_02323 [Syntrophorhabdus sp. PtaB.Bin006]